MSTRSGQSHPSLVTCHFSWFVDSWMPPLSPVLKFISKIFWLEWPFRLLESEPTLTLICSHGIQVTRLKYTRQKKVYSEKWHVTRLRWLWPDRVNTPRILTTDWVFGLSPQSRMTDTPQSDSSQDCDWCTQSGWNTWEIVTNLISFQ